MQRKRKIFPRIDVEHFFAVGRKKIVAVHDITFDAASFNKNVFRFGVAVDDRKEHFRKTFFVRKPAPKHARPDENFLRRIGYAEYAAPPDKEHPVVGRNFKHFDTARNARSEIARRTVVFERNIALDDFFDVDFFDVRDRRETLRLFRIELCK